jgi:hypothetical protein
VLLGQEDRMDSSQFDTLTRLLSTGRSRRGLASLLALVAAEGLFPSLLAPRNAGAKRKARDGKRGGHGGRGHGKRRQDRKDTRKPDGAKRVGKEDCIQTGKRCPAGKRGGKNGGDTLSCGRCCQGAFKIDDDGKKRCACKEDGVACDSDAHCCSATCQGGVCTSAATASTPPPPPPASAPSPTSPPPPPPPPPATCAGTCAGCCDGAQCLPGNGADACGRDGGACAVCSNPTPLCRNRTCAACTSHAQCGINSLCDDGSCVPCDVCLSGCVFTSVQEAINVAGAGDTIRICPGLYTGNFRIEQSLTLVGAGDGSGAGNTILRGPGSGTVVDASETVPVALRHLRITGGNANGTPGTFSAVGGGIQSFAILTLTGCTVIGNIANDDGGGIYSVNNLTLIDSVVTDNHVPAGGGGGIWQGAGAQLTLDADCRVTDNGARFDDPDSGGGIYNDVSTVTLNGAEVSGNTPDQCGGAPVAGCS